jgi:photosystem II stability/assembly factor-like uncharacterized protein
MRKLSVLTAALTIAAVAMFGISMSAKSQSGSSVQPQVQYKPSPAVKAKAMSPMPSTAAKEQTKKGDIGEGKMTVTTTDSNNDFWVEQIDVTGNGMPADTQMLWDNTDKMLYMYAPQMMTCKDGSAADTNLLVAVYGTGNAEKRPVGSGWWTSGLNQNQCGMKTEALYGCKFDQNGKNTQCGVAEMNPQTHELMIVEATTSR